VCVGRAREGSIRKRSRSRPRACFFRGPRMHPRFYRAAQLGRKPQLPQPWRHGRFEVLAYPMGGRRAHTRGRKAAGRPPASGSAGLARRGPPDPYYHVWPHYHGRRLARRPRGAHPKPATPPGWGQGRAQIQEGDSSCSWPGARMRARGRAGGTRARFFVAAIRFPGSSCRLPPPRAHPAASPGARASRAGLIKARPCESGGKSRRFMAGIRRAGRG